MSIVIHRPTPSSPVRSGPPAPRGPRIGRRLGWALAAALAVTACGGGAADGGDPSPSRLTADQAAQALTAAPRGYVSALAIRVSTSTIDARVSGVRQLAGPALRGDEAFPMGSLTKSMTATLAGILALQEGRLRWETRVVDVFPELAPSIRADYAEVTLADLLSHRGGLYPATTAEQLEGLPDLTGNPLEQRLQLVRWMLQQAPTSPPRRQTRYSNGDYVLAAAMLERVTAQPYESLLQDKVFSPMGLTVSFGTPGAAAGEPWGHARDTGSRWVAVDPLSPAARFPAFGHPAGGAKLDGRAFARYLQMHLRAHRGQVGEVITPATARRLQTVVADGFAHGWIEGRDRDGRALRWHDGSDDRSYYGLMAIGLDADVAAGVVVMGLDAASQADANDTVLRLLR